ncbi:MAG: hypothetical protein PUD65_10015 [Spirochaetales bacterium]|nr:hypothetical protein [Spirochaetales bacterium]
MISDALVFFRPVEFSINERPKKSQEKDASYRANIWFLIKVSENCSSAWMAAKLT